MAEMNRDFVKVADTNDIKPSQMKAVEVDGENICVVNVEGKYYAIGNVCTHVGGPLAEGTLEFDVRTGKVTRSPANKPELTYEIKVEGNDILVRK